MLSGNKNKPPTSVPLSTVRTLLSLPSRLFHSLPAVRLQQSGPLRERPSRPSSVACPWRFMPDRTRCRISSCVASRCSGSRSPSPRVLHLSPTSFHPPLASRPTDCARTKLLHTQLCSPPATQHRRQTYSYSTAVRSAQVHEQGHHVFFVLPKHLARVAQQDAR